MKTSDVYWLAGMLEGEGTFGFYPRGDGRSPCPRVSMATTDEDVCVRVADLLGGRVYRRKKLKHEQKPVFNTSVGGSRAAGWMMTLLPILGLRRRAKVVDSLRGWRAVRACPNRSPRNWAHKEAA